MATQALRAVRPARSGLREDALLQKLTGLCAENRELIIREFSIGKNMQLRMHFWRIVN